VGCAAQVVGSGFGTLAMFLNDPILLFIGCFCVGLGQVAPIPSSVLIPYHNRVSDNFIASRLLRSHQMLTKASLSLMSCPEESSLPSLDQPARATRLDSWDRSMLALFLLWH
jgi:hypothetical protein